MFVRLAQVKGGEFDGEIDALRHQHEQGRKYIAEMAIALEGYLQDDPIATSQLIENMAAYTAMLRNHIHEWFENRLNRRLVRREWDEARRVLREWQGLLTGDRTTDDGTTAYAAARSQDLRAVLRERGPTTALAALADEQQRYPGLATWDEVTRSVAESLQRPIDEAIGNRRVDDASAALEEQAALALQYSLDSELAPVDENRTILRHVIDARRRGTMWLKWSLVVQPLHDALLEDALDRAALALGDAPRNAGYSMWVRVLRAALGRLPRPEGAPETPHR